MARPGVFDIEGFKVDTAVVRTQAGRMRQFSVNLYDVLTAAKKKMNDMQTDAVWLSPAGALIIDKVNMLQPQIDRHRDILTQFCDFLENTAETYEVAEERRHMDAAGVGSGN